jgi:hypothetical protein
MIARFVFLVLLALVSQGQLVVTLHDGSRVVGTASADRLDIRTDYGELAIPLTRLLEMNGENGHFLIRLRNGDRFACQLRTPQLLLATRFGEQTIPAARIQNIRASVMSGIVAWWSADGDAKDRWGRHHGTGSFELAPDRHGRPNSAFNFADARHTIRVADHSQLDTPERFSLAAWIRPRSFRGPYSHNSFIISKWYTRPTTGSFIFGLGLQGELRLCVATSVEGFLEKELRSQPASIPLDSWTHVAATFERGHVALYINGNVAVSAFFEEVQRTEPKEYTHDEINIGGFWGKYYDFQGAMDELMVFNRALTPTEIANLAQD